MSVGVTEGIALGFERLLFIPISPQADRLGCAREGEGNQPWSGGAGSGAIVTGLVQFPRTLREI